MFRNDLRLKPLLYSRKGLYNKNNKVLQFLGEQQKMGIIVARIIGYRYDIIAYRTLNLDWILITFTHLH